MLFILLTPAIIAIEGGMGSGKSTLAKNLKEYSNKFKIVPESIQYLNEEEYNELWEKSGTPRAVELLFISEERRFNYITQHYKLENSIIVLDRSYLTFVAYEYAKNNKQNMNCVYKFIDLYKDKIVIPDYTIFLNISSEVRLQRITYRGDTNLPDVSMIHSDFNSKLMEYFKIQTYNKIYFIDTSAKTPAEILSESLKIIE